MGTQPSPFVRVLSVAALKGRGEDCYTHGMAHEADSTYHLGLDRKPCSGAGMASAPRLPAQPTQPGFP